MTRLVNDPTVFAAQALAGFAAAHPGHVTPVHGGVVRSTASPDGQVAVVLGGGSGHYPAFAGWVGPGMAHGVTAGNVFSSPAASQVYSVVRAAHNGGGVLLGFGNYAGDVLHFGQAAERLRAEGVDVRIVTVTDDIASGPADEPLQRRGIAGDLLVFKVAGAAAEAGLDLDAVEAVTRRANARTRSLGVAFAGCTLPGADGPLFTVPDGAMAVGLGIHGEPGLSEVPLGSADDLADQLVDGVLAEEPPRGQDGYDGRVAVLLNGLGATKYEELFVVYRRVAERLAEAGLTPVAPEVDEHVTSLDMAGVSLTLMFLDDELERLWTAPADTPAFRRGTLDERPHREVVDPGTGEGAAVEPGSPESQAAARTVVDTLRVLAQAAADNQRHLGDLDAVAGDGDHGQGMVLGTTGALREAEAVAGAGAGLRTVLVRAGAAWSESAGGTSGALWGAALTAAAGELDDATAPDEDAVLAATQAAGDAVVRLGGAQPGDKTMVDALVPFLQALHTGHGAGHGLREAWTEAAEAARVAAHGTADLVARLGRAKTHGDHSVGHPDPGAVSFALLMASAAAGRPAGATGTQDGPDHGTGDPS
jgi:dihydroxyacetone kinase